MYLNPRYSVSTKTYFNTKEDSLLRALKRRHTLFIGGVVMLSPAALIQLPCGRDIKDVAPIKCPMVTRLPYFSGVITARREWLSLSLTSW